MKNIPICHVGKTDETCATYIPEKRFDMVPCETRTGAGERARHGWNGAAGAATRGRRSTERGPNRWNQTSEGGGMGHEGQNLEGGKRDDDEVWEWKDEVR